MLTNDRNLHWSIKNVIIFNITTGQNATRGSYIIIIAHGQQLFAGQQHTCIIQFVILNKTKIKMPKVYHTYSNYHINISSFCNST